MRKEVGDIGETIGNHALGIRTRQIRLETYYSAASVATIKFLDTFSAMDRTGLVVMAMQSVQEKYA
jgi:hypothetical protein